MSVRHDFKCPDCGNIIEVSHGMHEDVHPACHCGAIMRKMFIAHPSRMVGPIWGMHREMTTNEYIKRKEQTPEVRSGKIQRVGKAWV